MTDNIQIIWTPWKDHAELLLNRTWLFPVWSGEVAEKPDMRRKACDQVRILRMLTN